MKKIIKSVFEIKTLSIAAILGIILISSSCNKDFENTLPTSFKNDTLGIGNNSKKVLYIILDGVRGSVVRTLSPTNLTQLTTRAIYTYDGIADYQRNQITNAASWTTMLTGVDYTKHGVTSETFAGLNLQAYPTIFNRIKSTLTNARTVSLASTAAFNDNLATDATVKQNFSDDAAVKNAAVNELKNSDPSVLVAQFHSAETAGVANGYTSTNASYTSAINTLDGYIGEIMTALTTRKGYAGENWLVVISSNKGGGVSGGTAGSNIFLDESRNTFVAFYNPKFSPVAYNMPDLNSLPYAGTSPKYAGANSNAIQTNASLANFGSSTDATIRFNIRWDYGNTTYPSFVTKRASFTAGVVGWTFFMDSGGTIGINFSQTGQSNTQRLHTRRIADGIWHNIAARFWKNGTTRYVTLYVDGIPAPSGDLNITNLGNLDTTSPLRLGSIGDANVNCIINDLAIYNIAIPEATVIAKSKVTPLTDANDPYYSSLIGYWKCNEGQGSDLIDATGKSAPFKISGTPSWSAFSDISPNISPEISQAAFLAVPNGVDIPVLIYNWMNIAVPSQWGLMGKFYNPIVNLPKN